MLTFTPITDHITENQPHQSWLQLLKVKVHDHTNEKIKQSKDLS